MCFNQINCLKKMNNQNLSELTRTYRFIKQKPSYDLRRLKMSKNHFFFFNPIKRC